MALSSLERLRVLKALQTAALRDHEALDTVARFYASTTPGAPLACAACDAVVGLNDYISILNEVIELLEAEMAAARLTPPPGAG